MVQQVTITGINMGLTSRDLKKMEYLQVFIIPKESSMMHLALDCLLLYQACTAFRIGARQGVRQTDGCSQTGVTTITHNASCLQWVELLGKDRTVFQHIDIMDRARGTTAHELATMVADGMKLNGFEQFPLTVTSCILCRLLNQDVAVVVSPKVRNVAPTISPTLFKILLYRL